MTHNEKFKKWMDSIPYGMYSFIRQLVIDECKITPGTYGNWRNGTCSIPPLALDKIEALSAEYAAQKIGIKISFNEKKAAQVEE